MVQNRSVNCSSFRIWFPTVKVQYSWIKHRECFIKFKTWGETLFLRTWFTFSEILRFSISPKRNPAKKKTQPCFADLKRAIKQSLFPLHLLYDRPFTLSYFFIRWSGSSTLYWYGWPPWFFMYQGGGGRCGLHLHRPWPLKYTVNLTLTGSKITVHNTKR